MTELVTNANDVNVYLAPLDDGGDGLVGAVEDFLTGVSSGGPIRVQADEFTLTSEQNISEVGDVGGDNPSELKGLSKGNLSHAFEFTIQGDQADVQSTVTRQNGDARPLEMRAEKPQEAGDSDSSFTYALDLVLCESEEISGTSGDPLGYSVEGVGAGRDRSNVS
jgi:hypothetical protein